MTSKKFLSISLLSVLVAVVVAFNACKKDDDNGGKKEKTAQELGKEAAQELCNCFSGAADQSDEMACMMGLMGEYAGLFRDMQGQGGNPDFEDAFSNEFMGNCNNIPDWFLQMWTDDDDEDLAELGAVAAEELCECFTEATTSEAEQACTGGFMPKYGSHVTNQGFQTALAAGLQGCSDVVPAWVWGMFGGE